MRCAGFLYYILKQGVCWTSKVVLSSLGNHVYSHTSMGKAEPTLITLLGNTQAALLDIFKRVVQAKYISRQPCREKQTDSALWSELDISQQVLRTSTQIFKSQPARWGIRGPYSKTQQQEIRRFPEERSKGMIKHHSCFVLSICRTLNQLFLIKSCTSPGQNNLLRFYLSLLHLHRDIVDKWPSANIFAESSQM